MRAHAPVKTDITELEKITSKINVGEAADQN